MNSLTPSSLPRFRTSAIALLLSLAFNSSAHAADLPLKVDYTHSKLEAAAKASMHSFTAVVTSYDAQITIDDATHRPTSAKISFDFNAVKTDDTKRDREMLHWLEHDKIPACSFTLSALTPLEANRYTATGKLTLHGQTRDLSFPVSLTHEAATHTYSIDGETVLDTRNFALPIIRKFGLLTVKPELTVRFHVQGQLTK